ncbi:MAG: glycosyltransferase family 4 protein [Candidatus Sulfotelmatobacter sp.]
MNEERPACLSVPQSGPLRINWILPSIVAAHGGLLNVFRTIQQLEAWGHENRVYVLGSLPGGSTLAREHIRKRYFAIHAEVEVLSDNIKDCDALIATSWPTAYAARSIGNTAQKFYFVQDIEHMFYARGSLYEFARQTYQFGFRGITLGSWIAEVLRRDFNMECSAFGFSYDRDAYANTGRRLLPAGKKRVLFYARPETDRRGFELGILALSLVAKKMPDVEFALVGFPRQSLDLPFPAILPGVLPISELGALYRSCDVALVLSHTNLSLLPLELMACGCAVVSNEGPNIEWLLTDRTVQLAKPDPKSLASAVIELLETDKLRLQKIEAGLAFAHFTDWTKEIRKIESALLANREYPHQPAPRVQHIQS